MSGLGACDHWHVSTTRTGVRQIFPERHDHDTAVRTIRDLLIFDGRTTGDPRYADAVAAIDRGYESYIIDRAFYVAFACACPPKRERSIQIWERCGSAGPSGAKR